MKQLLTSLADFVFPPSPAEKLLRGVTTDTLRSLYQPGTYQKNIQYLCSYSDPIVAGAIKQNKFHNDGHAAQVLGQLLALWSRTQPTTCLFIPIPLGHQRYRERGYNQVERILANCPTKLTIRTDVLTRTKETTPQSALTREQRLKNMNSVFTTTGKTAILSEYTHIIILDDVVTTGATMEAARATLAPHLPPTTTLRCLAIAH
jgi:ComF family protein